MKKILFILFFSVLAVSGCSLGGDKNAEVTILSSEEAKAKAENFINEYLMEGGTATVASVEDQGDLYKLMVDIGSEEKVESFLSKDGSSFYPQVFKIADFENKQEPTATAPIDVPKSDKPVVELFVMSHCPYGTQIEKGILPVVKTLGENIDFQLKFCDYIMHGEIEIKEQLNQYCVGQQDQIKLISYLDCFLKDEDSAGCLSKSGVDTQALNNCVSATDNEFKIMENFKDKSTYKGSYPTFNIHKADVDKYQVGGSPTLIINGQEASSARDSASLLNAICSAFNEKPELCGTQLSSASPSPGFGEGTGASTDASCN